MSEEGIRWKQRFDNYKKALSQLTSAINEAKKRELSHLEKQGLIKAFEFTFELAWNTLKDFYNYQGDSIQGSRDAIKTAFNRGLIENGETWMDMIINRNRTAHAYNEETANEIADIIIRKYHREFLALETTLTERAKEE